MRAARGARRTLPGFGLTLGVSLLYLSLIVLVPLAGLALKAAAQTWPQFWHAVSEPRALAAYRLSFGAAALAALLNAGFGFVVAWVLVRYRFPGKRIIDALVDLPFAMPTAVSGIALTTLWSANGWFGRLVEPLGARVAFTSAGVVIALTLVGLPFVVRTLQPALADVEAEVEEAATSLGASRWQTFRRVTMPTVLPALLTGLAMAFARAVGEYGSVVFIAGNMPMRTEIAPLLILIKLEQYDYAGATGIAVVMLAASFAVLLAINGVQWWSLRRWGQHG